MPRLRNPLTLTQACINIIVRYFDRLWGDDFDNQFGKIPSLLLYVMGPFNDLPGHICEDIFHDLEKKRLLRSTHIHLLLMPQMKHACFSSASSASLISQALVLLSVRCQKLLSLDLTNCRYVSPQSIANCLPSLSLLRTLILRQTKARGDILKLIATCLPHLIRLDLHGCPVTNNDALLLCGDSGDFEPACKRLAVLDITGTKVELTGCIAILRAFRNLHSLSFPDTLEAVAQLHKDEGPELTNVDSAVTAEDRCEPSTSSGSTGRKAHSSLPENHHKLEVLHATAIRCRKIIPDHVQLACSYCPFVREVYWHHDASDDSLKHLLQLQHLCVLEVSSDEHNIVTFHGGIRPLLLSRGQDMVAVGLYNIQGTDLGMLGYLCPRLQRLKVVCLYEEADFAQSYLTAKQEADSYKVLRHLTLVLDPHITPFDPSDLLIRGEALQEVHFIGVSRLTDQVLEAALSSHGFSCLKELHLESCDQITISCVTKLVTASHLLTYVSLKACQHISRQDTRDLHNLIVFEGLDITVEWA